MRERKRSDGNFASALGGGAESPGNRGVIRVSSPVQRSPRVMQLEGIFDLPPATESTVEIPYEIPSLDAQNWNIGLIVGPSGSGKSTVARELFGELVDPELQWSHDRSVVDGFPTNMGIKDVTQLLSSVGFSSPPAWLRPFHILSNGEKFRVTMARLLAENPTLTVVDEFTSVVDRTVAQIGSAAIARTVRQSNQKFVAVSCHYDVADWLQPDWIYQPDSGSFVWRSVQPRPQINMEVFRADRSAWQLFSRHHYLNHSLNPSARIYVGQINDTAAVLSAVLPFPHPKFRNAYRFSRTVVMPDFQGIGLGNRFTSEIAANYRHLGRRVLATLSHPALIRARLNSPDWICTRKPSRTMKSPHDAISLQNARATGRMTAGFEFVGAPKNSLAQVVV